MVNDHSIRSVLFPLNNICFCYNIKKHFWPTCLKNKPTTSEDLQWKKMMWADQSSQKESDINEVESNFYVNYSPSLCFFCDSVNFLYHHILNHLTVGRTQGCLEHTKGRQLTDNHEPWMITCKLIFLLVRAFKVRVL